MSAELPWLEQPLQQVLQRSRGHALLIHGPRGVGQLELALAVAGAWLCETHRGAAPACGRCVGCQLFAARTHPDLRPLLPDVLQIELDWIIDESTQDALDGKRKPSKDIRILQVRDAIDFTQSTSARGGPKVVLIHPAERMNAASASALLKTLEEPPGAARLILVSAAPQRLLATVRSRCQALALLPPPTEAAAQWLAGQGADEPELLLAAAGGRPLDAAERLAQGVTAAVWRALPREILAGRAVALAGWPLPLVIDTLQKLCHDALCVAAGATPRYFPAAALPPAGDLAKLAAAGRELLAAARHAEHPWNAPLGVETLVQRARRALLPTASPSQPAGGGGALATLAS